MNWTIVCEAAESRMKRPLLPHAERRRLSFKLAAYGIKPRDPMDTAARAAYGARHDNRGRASRRVNVPTGAGQRNGPPLGRPQV